MTIARHFSAGNAQSPTGQVPQGRLKTSPHPGGMPDNSPAFQRRERPIPHRPSPAGTAENSVILLDRAKGWACSPMRENQNKVAMKYAVMRDPSVF